VTDALRLDAVTFAYANAPVLREVSLALAPGERVALLGRNGAGKSTLVRLVAGLLRPAAGTVWVGDWDTRGRAPETLARRVGTLFQHADQQLFARTVREDVAFGPRALGYDDARCARLTADALDLLQLTPLADEHPYDLPPPLRKLAALAGTLAGAPALLLLDEPTAGLDRALKDRVRAAITAVAGAGTAVLVVTHDLAFAAETLDRALVLDGGRLACDESLPALLNAPPRLAPLGLVPPPLVALSLALALPGSPVRAHAVAAALAARCRGR
jgi:energy-coupling factor transporter ATP-binding protein EcfA2